PGIAKAARVADPLCRERGWPGPRVQDVCAVKLDVRASWTLVHGSKHAEVWTSLGIDTRRINDIAHEGEVVPRNRQISRVEMSDQHRLNRLIRQIEHMILATSFD